MKCKVLCEFIVEGKNKQEIEDYIRCEAGIDFYEKHIIIIPVQDNINADEEVAK